MQVNPNIFREYDIRGEVDKDLSPELAHDLGCAFATYAFHQGIKSLVVGRDMRLSSPAYHDAVIAGLLESGADVLDIGMVPTPAFYYSFQRYDRWGGIMVTGSHNPPEFNGFKLCIGKSTIYGEQIQRLYQVLLAGKFIKGKGTLTKEDILPDYEDEIAKRMGSLCGHPLVVLDAGSGEAGPIVPKLLSDLGVVVTPLYCEPDGHFPGHFPDPTVPANMEELKDTVLELGADCGIAFDGDADRIGVIDDKGGIVWGDRLLAIYAREILKEHPGGKIIFEVKCSQALVEDVLAHGGVPIMWKTGHSLIEAKIHEEKALLAGEMSGHMYFADNYYGYDDAIYAACRLVKILDAEKRPLSEMLAELPQYVSTPEIRKDCPDSIKFKVVERVKAEYVKKYDCITVDGVRVQFGDGWGLVRASNTQPVLVLRFEAKTQERLDEITQMMEKSTDEAIEAEGGLPKPAGKNGNNHKR